MRNQRTTLEVRAEAMKEAAERRIEMYEELLDIQRYSDNPNGELCNRYRVAQAKAKGILKAISDLEMYF